MAKRPTQADFVSRRLRVLREQTGLTQEQFAEATGLSYKVYQSMEAGRRWNLRYSTILKLADIHRLSVSQFFAHKTPRSRFKVRSSYGPGQRRRKPSAS